LSVTCCAVLLPVTNYVFNDWKA